MTIEEQASIRLSRTNVEAHLDALQHPDPCGTSLVQLLQAIEKHASAEASTIQAYAQLAQDTHDPVVAGLLRVLVDDEERHHRLYEQIGRSLQDQLNWTSPPPISDSGQTDVYAVRRFEQEERRESQKLRELAHRAHQQRDPLVNLLLETMAMDSEKHAYLLRFITRRWGYHPQ
jgi:rubrerythrin